MEHAESELSNELAQTRTDLAAQRTLMAADRSLMAWVRTGLSMIGFGFTIYAFLESLAEKGTLLTVSADGPRRIGLFLLFLGVISILLGTLQYWTTIKEVKKIYTCSAWRFTLIIAALIALLGLVLFVAMFVKAHFL